jgi:hypothetical protein
LVDFDQEADVILVAQILYSAQGKENLSKAAILAGVRKIKEEDLKENPDLRWSPRLVEKIIEAVSNRSAEGLNRRHKLPRAFEYVFAEIEFNGDVGTYKDLMRQRMDSIERVFLSAEKCVIPKEFREPDMEVVLEDYLKFGEWTKDLHRKIAASKDLALARAAEYVCLMGNKLRFNIKANLRQWCFIGELRTIEGGHYFYRRAVQGGIKQMLYMMPFLKPLFAYVNWRKNPGLGRLKAEFKTQQKLGVD